MDYCRLRSLSCTDHLFIRPVCNSINIPIFNRRFALSIIWFYNQHPISDTYSVSNKKALSCRCAQKQTKMNPPKREIQGTIKLLTPFDIRLVSSTTQVMPCDQNRYPCGSTNTIYLIFLTRKCPVAAKGLNWLLRTFSRREISG